MTNISATAFFRRASEVPEAIHRGIDVRLQPEDHEVVHDESRPVHERAQHLIDTVTRHGYEPLGQHWSTDRPTAEGFAHYHGPRESPERTKVVFHADRPDYDDIEHDSGWREEHEVNDLESEIPLRRGADVTVRGISWQRGDQIKGPWTRHSFDEEQWHTASLGATAFFRQAASERVQHTQEGTLKNPIHHEGVHPGDWFHGTPNRFTHFEAPDKHPAQHHDPLDELTGDDWSEHDFASDDDSYDGPAGSGHWNTRLGVHFAADHDVAEKFAGTRGRLIHARLHLYNPKVYASEHDMDREVFDHERAAGNHIDNHLDEDDYESHASMFRGDSKRDPSKNPMHNALQRQQVPGHWLRTHPDREGIADRFKQRLKAQGHDGIIYGNEVEANRRGADDSAIAFHTHQIEVSQVHKAGEPHLDPERAEDFRRHVPPPDHPELPFQARLSATAFFCQAAAHPGPTVEDYAKRDDESGYEHEARIKRGLSLGHLTYQQAHEQHRYFGGGDEDPSYGNGRGWQPLPHTLYHTTTDAAGVKAKGLRSGRELGQENGHGLGGTPEYLSLTDSADHAHNMLHALHEYHDVLTGKTSLHDLRRAAENGEGAERPYAKGFMSNFGHDPHHAEATMNEKVIEPGFSSHDEARERGWEPHPHLHVDVGEGKDGKHYGTGWIRNMTDDEKLYKRHEAYGAFSRARNWHGGGKPAVMFLSNDRKAFTQKDPSNFAVLKVRPKPGAQGFPKPLEHEWRTATGDAVEVHGEPLHRTGKRIGQAVRPSDHTARLAGHKDCPCCGGTGEHYDTGFECYLCDGGLTVPQDTPDDSRCDGRLPDGGHGKTAAYVHDPLPEQIQSWKNTHYDVPEEVTTPIHRGMTLSLSPEDHDYVHDRSISEGKRAAHVVRLADAQGGLGRHWSTDPDTAGYFSDSGANELQHHPHLLSVTLHAHPPAREHIERDPVELGRMGVQGQAAESEVPLKASAPVRLYGVSWRNTRDSTQSHRYIASAQAKGITRHATVEDGDDIPSRLLNPHGHHVKVNTGGSSNVEMVPTHEVARYASQETTAEHAKEVGYHVAQTGSMEPLILHYHPETSTAYLGEGNHRLRAARSLGMDHVPVRVNRNVYGLTGPGVPTPQRHPAIEAGTHVPADIKPSDIGLTTVHQPTISDEDMAEARWRRNLGLPPRGADKMAASADTPVPNNTTPYAHTHDWLPHDHFFAPGKPGLDPRLFDGGHIHPAVRQYILGLLHDFWASKYGDSWQSWARVYLAGSAASHFWGDNNDLDILIGVDWDTASRYVDSFAGEPHEALRAKLTDELKAGLNDGQRMLPGPDGTEAGPFDNTFFVIKSESGDIRDIKPYAAYDITRDTWVVEPVETGGDFGPEKLPESTWDITDAIRQLVRAVSELPPGIREREGAALYEYLHNARSHAFGPEGTGLWDEANASWKALSAAPDAPLEQLVQWKRAHDTATQEKAA